MESLFFRKRVLWMMLWEMMILLPMALYVVKQSDGSFFEGLCFVMSNVMIAYILQTRYESKVIINNSKEKHVIEQHGFIVVWNNLVLLMGVLMYLFGWIYIFLESDFYLWGGIIVIVIYALFCSCEVVVTDEVVIYRKKVIRLDAIKSVLIGKNRQIELYLHRGKMVRIFMFSIREAAKMKKLLGVSDKFNSINEVRDN